MTALYTQYTLMHAFLTSPNFQMIGDVISTDEKIKELQSCQEESVSFENCISWQIQKMA